MIVKEANILVRSMCRDGGEKRFLATDGNGIVLVRGPNEDNTVWKCVFHRINPIGLRCNTSGKRLAWQKQGGSVYAADEGTRQQEPKSLRWKIIPIEPSEIEAEIERAKNEKTAVGLDINGNYFRVQCQTKGRESRWLAADTTSGTTSLVPDGKIANCSTWWGIIQAPSEAKLSKESRG